MKRRAGRTLAVLLAGAMTRLPAPAPAFAQAPAPALSEVLHGPARADYDAGRQRLAAGDFAGARAHFARAYDLVQDPRLLANLALAEKNLGHCGRATTLFEQALATGAGLFAPAQLHDVHAMVRQCAAHVSRARFAITPAGATIAVDDVVAAGSPISTAPAPSVAAELWLDEGAHRVRVSKPGFRDQTATVNASGGRPIALEMHLEPLASAEPGPGAEGTLTVRTAPENDVVIDGVAVGRGESTSRLAAGVHRLTVSAPGRKSYESDVRVASAQNRTFDVALEPDRGAPIWMWGVGGAVVVAGIIVAAAVVFRSPGPVSPPAAVTAAPH